MNTIRVLFAVFLLVLASPAVVMLFAVDVLSEMTGVHEIHSRWFEKLGDFINEDRE